MSIPDMPGISIEVGFPLAVNQRFINLISSDCDLLIRAPKERSSLLSVCESISAVISTACAWCMIMPCINCTSASECGGSLARVVGGSVRVGCPGAPGWTTTGADPDCCAKREGNENVGVIAAKIALCHTATLMIDLSLRSALDFMALEWSRTRSSHYHKSFRECIPGRSRMLIARVRS